MNEIHKDLPVWVLELPPEAFAAEIAARIVVHPEVQEFTRGDHHLCLVIQEEFEKQILEKIRGTSRYRETERNSGLNPQYL